MHLRKQTIIRTVIVNLLYVYTYMCYDTYICRNFTATEARLLRVAVGSYLDHLILVVDTMKRFGQSKTSTALQEP